MKDRKFFSEQIRLWRIGKGLSLRKASKRFGISPKTFVNSLESRCMIDSRY